VFGSAQGNRSARSAALSPSAGACNCDASAFELDGDVLGRLICNCRVCQQLYKAPFADIVAMPGSAITVTTSDAITYKRYRSPPAHKRGTCHGCGEPVVDFLHSPARVIRFHTHAQDPDACVTSSVSHTSLR